jgi:predicted N-acetyltransferase YhbS
MSYRFVTHEQVPDLPQQLAALSNEAFAEYEGAPLVEASFANWYLSRPGSTPDVCFAALAGEQMVANVLVALQPLVIGGETITCGIVDTVATSPHHRRQGLAHQLMERAHDRMQVRGAEMAVLYTNPANHPYHFYGRLGYLTRAQCVMLAGPRPEAAGGPAVRPATAGEAGAVRALVNERYGSYEGYAPQDETLWAWHRVNRPALMPLQQLVAEGPEGLVGTAALAEVELLLEGQQRRVTVAYDLVYPDLPCLQALLAAAPSEHLVSLHSQAAPACADLHSLGLQASVGEVAMVLPFTQRAEALLRCDPTPWYVMVESVIGV